MTSSTDKALEAALLPCPHCGSPAKYYHRDEGSGWSNTDWVCCENDECGCGTCLHETADIAIAAWNRRAPFSALPGEAEVDDFIRKLRDFDKAYGEEIFAPLTDAEKATVGGELRSRIAADMGRHLAKFFVQAADALQSLQARAEAAERERGYWQKQHDERTFFLGQCATEKKAAEARVKELEEAFHVNVTDQELVRINNMAVGTDEVTISSRMMLTLVGCIIAARTALKGGSNG